jgi:hypothetical protein
MIAYNYQPQSKTLENPIVVVPTSAKYADQMVTLMCETYNCIPAETYNPEKFRNQARVFPEGQFVALDTRTDKVVGLTASMRLHFNAQAPLLTSWVETTNYG